MTAGDPTAEGEPDRPRAEGVETRPSPQPFDDTVDRLLAVIHERGLRLFDVVDHRAAAIDAGLDLRPTRVLVFGSPAAGTPLMVERPLLALELPLRILVWEADDGTTQVSWLHGPALADRFGLDPDRAAPLGAPPALIAAALGPG